MIELNLSLEAARVLGCLVEKERTTPEYYPLSLNALTNACNQKTNRDPVMSLAEADVLRALESLLGAGLAMRSAEGGRVVKYGHNLTGKLQLDKAEMSILAELLLRGPQTSGELRARVLRMVHIEDLFEVEAALQNLMAHEPPLVARLSRQPGRKESRYRQLLAGPSDGDEAVSGDAPGSRQRARADQAPPESDTRNEGRSDGRGEARREARSDARSEDAGAGTRASDPAMDSRTDERVARLEAEVELLRAEIARLWTELRSLTMQPE